MRAASTIPVVMTVAGSDSGGGAGIQADLKVFSALGVFGTTAITCITAQNPDKVTGVVSIEPAMVALQIRTVCNAFAVQSVKTGMLYTAGIIRSVAKTLTSQEINILVIDPVMIATSGRRLIQRQAFHALCSDLLPIATIITPNISEAELLVGKRIICLDDIRRAVVAICKKFGTACVLKGGHLSHKSGKNKDKVVDVLCVKGDLFEFCVNRISAVTTHGTGCRFSAALTAYLAKRTPVFDAVSKAQQFVAETLTNPLYSGN